MENAIPTPTVLKVDLAHALSMQGLYDSVSSMFHYNSGTTAVVGMSVPILNIECNTKFVIDPEKDIKEAISRLYDYCMKSILQPIWNILEKLYEALKKFGLAILDFKLPFFDLHISDLFKGNLYEKIKAAVIKLYYKEKQKLIDILKALGIPYPFHINIQSIELEIESIIKKILASLWGELFKKIYKIIDLIEKGLELFDIATHGVPTLSVIWKKVKKAVLGEILKLLALPPSIEDLRKAIVEFAKKLYNKAEVTFEELIEAVKHFKLPILGSPLDWKLPISIKVSLPNIHFDKILNDIKMWVNNYIVSLLKKFIELIGKILEAFGLVFILPVLIIPLIFCKVTLTNPNNLTPATNTV
jgi:hypothetical protein